MLRDLLEKDVDDAVPEKHDDGKKPSAMVAAVSAFPLMPSDAAQDTWNAHGDTHQFTDLSRLIEQPKRGYERDEERQPLGHLRTHNTRMADGSAERHENTRQQNGQRRILPRGRRPEHFGRELRLQEKPCASYSHRIVPGNQLRGVHLI